MLQARLEHQQLLGSALRRPEQFVRWFGAMQAQDYAGAKWAIALRSASLSDAAIERAFAAGRILRTHVLRPTWHFVAPADIRWLLALTGPRVQRILRGYAHHFELDARVLGRGRRVVERALSSGTHLTRAELSAALGRAGLVMTGQRLAHLLMDLELQAVICSGPRRGKQFTYALLDERVPAAPPMAEEEAVAALAARYFQSHGPATLRDFVWWSGLTVRQARAGVQACGIEPLATPRAPLRHPGATFLLPNYDEYLVAYRDRAAVVDPTRARNLGVFTSQELPHQLIVDGRVAGSWRRTIADTSLFIEVRCYTPLTRSQRHLVQKHAARYAECLGVSGRLQISDERIK